MQTWTIHSPDPETTHALGAALGRVVIQRTVVALVGELGAGKTCFAQGVGDGLAVAGEVVSPTFQLLAEHEGRLPLLHADTYRLTRPELPGVGLEEALDGWNGVALVEWGDRFPEILPDDHLCVSLHHVAVGRRVEIGATGPAHEAVLADWRAHWVEQSLAGART